jgi:hypothetical protein
VNLAIIDGRLEDAERLGFESLAIAERTSQPDAVPFFAAQLTNIRYEQGRLGELRPLIEQVLGEHSGITGFHALYALACCQDGSIDEVARALASGAPGEFVARDPDPTWLSAVCIWAIACAHVGDSDIAELLYRALVPWASQIAFPGVGAWGCVDHYLGLLATVRGDLDATEAHLLQADRCHRHAGAPIWMARTQLEIARLLRARGGATEREKELLQACLSEASARGCDALAHEAESLLASLVHA